MSTVPWLDPLIVDFPPVQEALEDPGGLLAVGGDLSVERLLAAYRRGIFPWYESPQPILWWSPAPRAVLFPERIHISHSLGKRLKRQEFQVSLDQCFDDVIAHCAGKQLVDRPDTWIGEEMISAYRELYRLGHAHSVECWHEGQLAGGLYGIAIGKVFFGESMFSLRTDASKVAFVHLARRLKQWGFPVIDCQVSNPHLLSLGAEEIDRGQFIDIVEKHIDLAGPEIWSMAD